MFAFGCPVCLARAEGLFMKRAVILQRYSADEQVRERVSTLPTSICPATASEWPVTTSSLTYCHSSPHVVSWPPVPLCQSIFHTAAGLFHHGNLNISLLWAKPCDKDSIAHTRYLSFALSFELSLSLSLSSQYPVPQLHWPACVKISDHCPPQPRSLIS